MPSQDPNVRNSNFLEVALGYTEEQALDEAQRCLHCKNHPCVSGCPVNVKIPEFIGKIVAKDYEGAYQVIHETSSLPAVCGRVCPQEHQCEGKCILNAKGQPIAIGRLERFVADTYIATSACEQVTGTNSCAMPVKGKKVACIGSGPSSLTCAGVCAANGLKVDVFEALHEPGGVLIYGIPSFRLPKNVVATEVDGLRRSGVDFHLNSVGGRTFTVDELRKEYDAVFIGVGAGLPVFLGVPGENLVGVFSANEYLTRVNLGRAYAFPEQDTPAYLGKHVTVFGAGNVAMDAARTARRLGADVTVIYRRTQAEMTAIQSEYDEAVKEGVHFMWQSESQAFIGNERGRVCAIRLATPEGERTVPFDRVFLAIGSRPASRIVSTTTGIEVDEKGYVKVGERPYGMTTRRGVFAGGDVVHRPQTVVLAMKAAKDVAVGIAQYVDAIKLLEACGE